MNKWFFLQITWGDMKNALFFYDVVKKRTTINSPLLNWRILHIHNLCLFVCVRFYVPLMAIELKVLHLLTAAVASSWSVHFECGRSGFDPRSGQTLLLKTVSDSSIAKRSATGVSVTGLSRCSTLKTPYCSVAMIVEHKLKFEALRRQWWCLHMIERFSSGTKGPQTNKQKKHTYWDIRSFVSWAVTTSVLLLSRLRSVNCIRMHRVTVGVAR